MRLNILWVVFISLFTTLAMATEEAKYSVLEKSGEFELRIYAPRIVAETMIDGALDDASSIGFKRIADYIFGNNTAIEGANKKISMTTPVSMQQTARQWRMAFVMPSQFTFSALPKPNNALVTLREIPQTRMAVLRFSGLVGEEKMAEKAAELMAWLKTKSITPIGEPEIARYNPPWTLPFLRRNEVMVVY